jgi:hypothetical protein
MGLLSWFCMVAHLPELEELLVLAADILLLSAIWLSMFRDLRFCTVLSAGQVAVSLGVRSQLVNAAVARRCSPSREDNSDRIVAES